VDEGVAELIEGTPLVSNIRHFWRVPDRGPAQFSVTKDGLNFKLSCIRSSAGRRTRLMFLSVVFYLVATSLCTRSEYHAGVTLYSVTASSLGIDGSTDLV
jgi:hypothetical protein